MAPLNSVTGNNKPYNGKHLQAKRRSAAEYQRNLTVRQLLLDLFKKNKCLKNSTGGDGVGDMSLAENINLIRSNLEFIIANQECLSPIPTPRETNTTESPVGIKGKGLNDEDEERKLFLTNLYSFMETQGQPIIKPPKLGFRDLDLHKLYKAVVKRGGMDYVTRRQLWKEVYLELGIPTMSTSASYNTRTNYKKYLYLYELENEPQLSHGLSDGQDQEERSSEGEQLGGTKCKLTHSLTLDPVCSFRFCLKQHIKIESKLHEGQVFYAKILKRQVRDGIPSYYIMYNGWTVSHNEWMPEYALQQLSAEEEQCPEKLTNPPSIRSSKSNYLIEEHLGISVPSSPSPAFPISSGGKMESGRPMRTASPQPQPSPLQNESSLQRDIAAANILTSFPSFYAARADRGLDLLITPPPFDVNDAADENQKNRELGLGIGQIESNLGLHSLNHEIAYSQTIAPMDKFFLTAFIPPTGKRKDTHIMTADSMMGSEYPQKRARGRFNSNTIYQRNVNISRSKNEIPVHSNGNYFIGGKPPLGFRRSEEMSPATTQLRSEDSRRRRYNSALLLKAKNSQSEQAALESMALHALPPSNGRPNPPSIGRNNLSQLATQVLVALSKQQEQSIILEENANEEIKREEKEDGRGGKEWSTIPSVHKQPASWIPSSKILKLLELSDNTKQQSKEETNMQLPQTLSLSRSSPEIKQRLEYLRNKVIQEMEKYSAIQTSSSNNSDGIDFISDAHLGKMRRKSSFRKPKDSSPLAN